MEKIYRIPVCTRCRSKKIRCDTGRPRCRHCARADTACEFVTTNSSQNTTLSSRDQISALEKKLNDLEVDCALLRLERGETARHVLCDSAEKAALTQGTVIGLMKNYLTHCQFPYSILLEDEILKKIECMYALHDEPFTHTDGIPDKILFIVSMVTAISSLSLSRQTPKARLLAEFAFSKATSRLHRILGGKKDIEMLQCVLLLLLYSMRHCTGVIQPWYLSGIPLNTCCDPGLFIKPRTGLYLTSCSIDLGLNKATSRVKHWREEEVSAETLQERQTAHFLQLQHLQQLIYTRLYAPREQDQHRDRHEFVLEMDHSLENWKIRAQQLAAADVHTTEFWKLWFSCTTLHLLRPMLQQPIGLDYARRCYSLSSEIIDISFAQLFTRRHIPFLYSWKDNCDIILGGVTFLYLITFSDVTNDDVATFSKKVRKWTAVLKNVVQNWPGVVQAESLLLSLARHTMDSIRLRHAGNQSEEQQQNLPGNQKMTANTEGVVEENVESSSMPCSDNEEMELPAPRTKVRRVLAYNNPEGSGARHNGADKGTEESFFNEELIRRHGERIMTTILGISQLHIEEEYDTKGYQSFLGFVDSLHDAVRR